MAHVRRKFYDLMEAHRSPVATEAVERIGALYAVEKEIRGRPPEERREVRATRTRPLLDSLYQWLQASLARLSRKSDTAAAVRYALARWDALVRYCADGRIEIDNSSAERALRCVAVGRRNYLFAGSDAGGERAAVIYSLIGSAKLNGLDPEAYLRQVLNSYSGLSGKPYRRPSALEHHAHGQRCSPIHRPLTHASKQSFRKCPRAKYVGTYNRHILRTCQDGQIWTLAVRLGTSGFLLLTLRGHTKCLDLVAPTVRLGLLAYLHVPKDITVAG
jgi:hypothetical protein